MVFNCIVTWVKYSICLKLWCNGSNSQSILQILYVGKPRIESKMATKIDLNADTKLTLDCMSSGFPTPEIKWRRLDGRPLPIRTVTHSAGLLSIYEVGQLDRGDYQCISLNPFGNDTRTFSVNITGKL